MGQAGRGCLPQLYYTSQYRLPRTDSSIEVMAVAGGVLAFWPNLRSTPRDPASASAALVSNGMRALHPPPIANGRGFWPHQGVGAPEGCERVAPRTWGRLGWGV